MYHWKVNGSLDYPLQNYMAKCSGTVLCLTHSREPAEAINPEDVAGCSTSTAASLHPRVDAPPDPRKLIRLDLFVSWNKQLLKRNDTTHPTILLCHSRGVVMKYQGFGLVNNLQILHLWFHCLLFIMNKTQRWPGWKRCMVISPPPPKKINMLLIYCEIKTNWTITKYCWHCTSALEKITSQIWDVWVTEQFF